MATYVNNLRLTELATGEGSGTWGTTTNTSLELIGEALGYNTQNCFSSDADATTTVADGASDPARSFYFKVTSSATLSATRTLTIAPNTLSRVMFIENATTGSQSIAISQGSGANVTIATGKTAVVYLDGAGSGAAVVDAMAGVDPGITDTLAEVLVAGNASSGTNVELTTTDKVQFRDTAIYLNSSADGQLDIVADTEVQIAATTIDINGNVDISGTAGIGGVLTANAGVVVDNITIDGNEIDVSSGNLTLDVAGETVIDSGSSGILRLKVSGTDYGMFFHDNTHMYVQSNISDGDMVFRGKDGGSTITALTLDMSNAGAATFNAGATFASNVGIGTSSPNSIVDIRENATGGQARLRLFNTDQTNSTAQSALLFMSPDLRANGVEIEAVKENADFSAAADRDIAITFSPVLNNTATERMRIDSSGNAGIGTSSPDNKFVVSDAGGAGLEFIPQTSNDRTTLLSYDRNANAYQTIDLDALDVHFNTSGTERMRIDASGNLLVGTTSSNAGITATSGNSFVYRPAAELTVARQGSGTTSPVAIFNQTGDDGQILDLRKDGSTVGSIASVGGADIKVVFSSDADQYITGNAAANYLSFSSANAERMRIDSSGTLNLGTTLNVFGGADRYGYNFYANGQSNQSIDGTSDAVAQYINRENADGPFTKFYKDRVEVGSIGVANGDLNINGDTGIRFQDTSIMPRRAGSDVDATVDIGLSSHRWKDLYLSGVVRLGTSTTYGTIEGKANSDLEIIANAGQVNGNPNIIFKSSNAGSSVAERMRIDSSGNVGIGCSPSRKVHITEPSSGTDGQLRLAYDATNYADYSYYSIDVAASNPFLIKTGGSERFRIASDGSLSTPTAGTSNVRFGVNAGNSITSGGNYNVVVGDEAGTAITTGDENVFMGYKAGQAVQGGSANVAIGNEALHTEDGHGRNVAVGLQSLHTLNAGADAYNTAVGYKSGKLITTGVQNTLIGGLAGDALTDADYNTAVGYSALTSDTLGSRSVAMGTGALGQQNFTSATNAYNTAVGMSAGGAVTTGVDNTLIGGLAGDAITDADYNVALGNSSLSANTVGSKNTAIGSSALLVMNPASAADTLNTAVGYHAGRLVSTGVSNTLLGGLAGDALTDADFNIAIGVNTLGQETLGSRSTAIGYSALFTQNNTSATNANNTAVGYVAGYGITTGSDNTLMGVSAGASLTTGSNNLFLGHDAGITGSPGGNHVSASSRIVLGDENIAVANIQVDWTVASDARDKTDFTALDLGLEFVKDLKPVTYKWDKRSKYGDKYADGYDLNAQTPDGTHKEDWLDVGFKAQEVEALEIAAGYNKDNNTNLVSSHTNDGKQMGLQYSKFVPILVKAIQEQQALIDALTARIETLEG